MDIGILADQLIDPHVPRKKLRKKSYRTGDIVQLVQEVIRTDAADTRRLASYIPRSIEGLRMLFDFVDTQFRYVEDPRQNQWVQTPSYLWHTKEGDCKSFTVFISSVLQNMGVAHLIRYVSYSGGPYTHVYPVALWQGREVPMDVVWKKQEGGRFAGEKPFVKKKDFKVEGLYKLGSTHAEQEAAIIGQIKTTIEEMEAAAADIPTDIIDSGAGDVTRMTSGQLDRLIIADRYRILASQATDLAVANQYRDAARAMERGDIAGIGSLQNDPFGRQVERILAKTAQDQKPAFESFKIQIPNPIPAHLRGFFKNVGNFFKKAVESVTGLWKKMVNWVFKGVGKAMGPFFIFQFLNRSKVKSSKIKQRYDAQRKSYEWIRKTGKFEDAKLKGVMLNGIVEQLGKSPAQLATEAGAPQVGAIAAIVVKVISAIKPVIEVIKKIAGIFKKKDNEAGVVDQSTMSDPRLLEEEAALQKQSGNSPDNVATGGGGGGLVALALPALAAFALLK